jgi:hypothetical protein
MMSVKNLLLALSIALLLVSLSVMFGLWDDPPNQKTSITRAEPEAAAKGTAGSR